MHAELERLVLREDGNKKKVYSVFFFFKKKSGDDVGDEDPASHMLMVQLLERASDPKVQWSKPSSLPVRL